jgi:hypothetical protein
MDAQTLDTYSNLLLLVTVIGGAAFWLYRSTRKKSVEPMEVPKRPESFRPKTKGDEEVYEGPPITDFREMPARIPTAVPKPPSFRPVKSAPVREKDLKTSSGGFKTAVAKPKASTGRHSPYRSSDDVDVSPEPERESSRETDNNTSSDD